jgi:hypothetical protein
MLGCTHQHMLTCMHTTHSNSLSLAVISWGSDSYAKKSKSLLMQLVTFVHQAIVLCPSYVPEKVDINE